MTFYRIMAKGIDLEVKIRAFLQYLFEDLGFLVLEARQQMPGTQNGFDIRITFLDASGKKREFYFECKDYTSPLSWNELLRKIHELHASGYPADGFIGISPRRNLSNINAGVQHTLPGLVKFPIRFWTPDAHVDEYLSLDATLYQEIYGEAPPEVDREKIKQKLRLMIHSMLQERDELPRTPAFPKDLTLKIPKIHADDIVGRADELKALREALFQNKQIVLVNGLGGIGKTTLAQGYLSAYYDDYQHIAWIAQKDADITRDIAQDEGLLHSLSVSVEGKDVQQLFHEIIHRLKTAPGKPNLLVLDNADRALTTLKDLLPGQPDWHLLVTSRERIEGFHTQEIGFLSATAALALFKKHCRRLTDDARIRELLAVVDYHTLTLEILAKTAQLQRADIDTLKSAIEQDLRANVYVAHKGDKVDRVRSYLSSIFTLSRLTEHEVWLIKYFACLPAEYHPYTVLRELIAPEMNQRDAIFSETLMALADQGWLLYNEETDSYKMHRIITDVAVKQLPISLDDVASLVQRVTDKLLTEQPGENPVAKFPWIPFGKILASFFSRDQPEVIAKLRNNLAMVLLEYGDYTEAKAQMEQAVADYDSLAAAPGLNYTKANTYHNLGLVFSAMGDYTSARQWLEMAILIQEQYLGSDHPRLATYYSSLAVVLQHLGNYADAKRLLEKCVSFAEEELGEDHPTTALRYFKLGTVLMASGDLAGAYTLLERALRISEKHLDADHPQLVMQYSTLAQALLRRGENEQARVLAEKALTFTEKTLGADHPTMATHLTSMAWALNTTGNYTEAKELLVRAIEITSFHKGAESSETAVLYSHMSSLYKAMGDYAQARVLLEQAIRSDEKNFGRKHPATLQKYASLSELLQTMRDDAAAPQDPVNDAEPDVTPQQQRGKTRQLSDRMIPSWLRKDEDDAVPFEKTITESTLEKLLTHIQQEFPDDEDEIFIHYQNLAIDLFNAENYQLAKYLLEKHITLCEQRFGTEHDYTVDCYTELARVHNRLGNYDEARGLLEKAITFFEREYGPDDLRTILPYGELGDVLDSLSEYEHAKVLLEKFVKGFARHYGADHPEIADYYQDLARTLRALDEDKEAAIWLKKAVSVREKHCSKYDPELAESYMELAEVLETLKDHAKAKLMVKKAITCREKSLGKEHIDTLESYILLARIQKELGEYEPAYELLRTVITIKEITLGEQDAETIKRYVQLANVLSEMRIFEEARILLQRAIRLGEANADIDAPELALYYESLATLFSYDEVYDQARTYYEKAAAIKEKVYGPESILTTHAYMELAEALEKGHDYKTAGDVFRKLIKIHERQHGTDHPETMIVYVRLAIVLKAIGHDAEVDQLSERALAYVTRMVPADQDPDDLHLYAELGSALYDLGHYKAARTLLEEIVLLQQKQLGETDLDTVASYHRLSRILRQEKDHTAHKRIYEYIVKAGEEEYASDRLELMELYDAMAGIYEKTGDFSDAKRLLKKVISTWEGHYGKNDPDTVDWYKRLAVVLQALGDHAGVKAIQKKIPTE